MIEMESPRYSNITSVTMEPKAGSLRSYVEEEAIEMSFKLRCPVYFTFNDVKFKAEFSVSKCHD